jgi:hypothetical protein
LKSRSKTVLHRTFESYYHNQPEPEEQDHPDGPLWIATREEIKQLPRWLKLETTRGTFKVVELLLEHPEIRAGIRGRRDD